ncbi:telomerase reverse transcriptase [Plasmodium cynomolgi strain B]|uniref:Telomerase reverse transcriptase n=1 Tax=Plasmodium cynomolgi (strain B) TaxID=1120755 RepID=K6UMQ4_PLACD|nr:telomerase reverse transcriptase [Plasmodium cynomolgi strain B]GAB68808.1 telomerase reverse transcriptase [Plasmodium cynomolgi strain B]
MTPLGTCEDGGDHVRSGNCGGSGDCVGSGNSVGSANWVGSENCLRNIFQCTDKKIKIFKTYLKKKLKVESYTLGEYSLKHDEKFRRIFFANILKEHVIAKRKKDKLFILKEVIMDKTFFEENFYYQYFLQNVLLLEDLTLKRLEGNHHGDFFFKEKKNDILNWKQGYSHVKKKLNEKGIDQKSKIYKNSVLLFNSTKFSYEDKNCCDYFYSLKVWDIFFNYVSFDFLNYLLSNTLIFISDFFFINLSQKLPVQNSFLVLVSHVDLKYEDNKEVQDTIFSKKKKLAYNTKQVKILYQRDQPRRPPERALLSEPTDKVVNFHSNGNPPQGTPFPLHINDTPKKRDLHREDDQLEGDPKEKFQSVSKPDCAKGANKRKIDQWGSEEEVTAGRKCKKKKKTTTCDTSKEGKQIDHLKYAVKNKEAQREGASCADDTHTDGQQYKYLFKKKKQTVRRNDVNSYVNHLYLVQCSGRIIKNEFLKEMKEIQKENEQAEEVQGAHIEDLENGIEAENGEEEEPQRKVLPQISFFSDGKPEMGPGEPLSSWKCKAPQEEKKKWSKIIINRNNILQHNTTNKYKNFLLNKTILFDKIENIPLFTYHLLNYIFKSDQKYFFHNNFIDEYKHKISKQIKCNTKKNDISFLLLRKENTTPSNVSLCSRSKDKRNNVSARLKKTKILKYVYCHFEQFIKNTRYANFDKMYRQYFPKNKMKNKIGKIFKTIKSRIIDKYKIVFIKNVKKFVLLNYKENFTMDQMMKHVRVKNVFQKRVSHRGENRHVKKNVQVDALEGSATQLVTPTLPNPCSTETRHQEDKAWKPKRSRSSRRRKQMRFFDPEKDTSLFETLRRKYLKKKKINIAILKRHFLNRLIYFLFNYFIMPVIRKYFFLTKSEHTIYKTIFFDRKLWNYFTKVSNFCLYHQNFRGKKLKRKEESAGKGRTRGGELKRRKLQKGYTTSNGRQLENISARKGVTKQAGIWTSPRVLQIRGRQIQKGKERLPALPNGGEKKREKRQSALIRSGKKKEGFQCGKNKRRGRSTSSEPNKRIEDLYQMTILSKKTVRPYLTKFYYKVKKKYFSLRKRYLLHGTKMIPLRDKQFAQYIHFADQKGHLFRFICKRFFKKTKRNYVKRFYRLVKRVKRRMMGIKRVGEGGAKQRRDDKTAAPCEKNDRIRCTKVKTPESAVISWGTTPRRKPPEKKRTNGMERPDRTEKAKRTDRTDRTEKANKAKAKKIHIHKIKSMIEKRNFLLKLNSINRFFSKKLRINWVPKKKGLRPLINLSTLNIPESVKNRIREILKNKKSSEFYFHNILNNMERDSKEKKSRKKKYNRKNFNPVSLNHICNFSLKCLGNVRNNNSDLFQNTLTKTNETELKLKKWLDYLKNWFYRKKKIKNI